MSPSTPINVVPLMNQTIALLLPSVVVTAGEAGKPRLALVVATHQATVGLGGEPGGTRTDMTTLPEAPPAGQTALLLVVKTTCVPRPVE